jgi:hypothetical protein
VDCTVPFHCGLHCAVHSQRHKKTTKEKEKLNASAENYLEKILILIN